MSEISSARPIAPSPVTMRQSASAADLAVRLLTPLDGIMAAGESARAEVMAIREQTQSFQVLLKLTLHNGQQTTVQAESNKALSQGSQLSVTALTDNRISLSLLGSSPKALSSLDLKQLPVDTLVQGKVISREAINGPNAQAAYRMTVNLLNSPLAGSQLKIDTNLALPVGSLLTAKVQDRHNLAFMPLTGRVDQLELNQQLLSQHNKQGSLNSLLNSLQNSGNSALRGSIEQLLSALPDANRLSTSKGVAQAIENSGVLFETKLLQGHTAELSQDLKANLLKLVAQLLPHLPGAAGTLGGLGNALAQQMPALSRQMLGGLSPAAASRQQALSFPLNSRLLQEAEDQGDLETLLKLAAAAISRLQTHQLSSLAHTQVDVNGNLLTTWQLEIPMRQQQEFVPLQLKIQQEQSAEKDQKAQPKQSLWRIDLAFDLEHLGPLQVRAQLQRNSLSSELWAERSETAALINHELSHLRQCLHDAGLEVEALSCAQGRPAQVQRTSLEQRWVDETA